MRLGIKIIGFLLILGPAAALILMFWPGGYFSAGNSSAEAVYETVKNLACLVFAFNILRLQEWARKGIITIILLNSLKASFLITRPGQSNEELIANALSLAISAIMITYLLSKRGREGFS